MSRPITPLLAVDAIVCLENKPGNPIVLIERANPPYGWAIPGGFVDVGETTEAAVIRELKEEAGLDIILTGLLGVYSDPARDPRGHTVGIVYMATAMGEPMAGDDAKNVQLFSLDNLPSTLAFDHAKILEDYCNLSR